MASRSVWGSIAVLVTTSVMEEPTRPWFGVLPVLSSSAISRSVQSPMRSAVILGKNPTPPGSMPPAKRVSGLIPPNTSLVE